MSRFGSNIRSKRWWAGALTVLVAPLAVVAASALQAEAAVAPVPGSTYTLAAANSGRCVDIPDGSKDNGALLQQWGCHADYAWQQFVVQQVSSGVFTLVSVNSGKCVDVPTDAVAGTRLQQWGCGDAAKTGQQFRFTASGSGTYQLTSVRYGLCLSVRDATANGAAVVVDTCATSSTQQWGFTFVTGGAEGGATCPCTVASDGTGQYKTVQAAIDAVPANNTSRRVITIKAGTYREIVTIPSNKPYITLQGAGSAASGVVIVNNHSSAGGYGTSGSATFFANGKEFNAANLTIKNDYGTGSQAVALNLNADKIILRNVRVLGNQDTLLTNSGRAYVVNSYIEGTTDFIFGGSIAVFHNSTIHNVSSTGGVMTAANTAAANTYGYLFYKCTVNNGGGTNVTTLGRPWGPAAQVLYRESTLSAGIKYTAPWQDMSSNSWKNARFFSYKNTGAGAAVNSNTPQMSDSQAANYTPQKYLAGSDGWNPL
ncbi:pectinesterase [Actinoplanes lutulentus]|uniref:Pectinesterase n=1 Tax=Actinoplanes lutulentus TaxID=1287878 RepID=A0A327ZC76_9ACTN|nr:pectinesterase family protein [Actinoplanes lutulentus]MBB2947280.1 pectinesterase [Actinoplanes lutulentus]RAK36555.1 pectinesterase [Actinoplanes lutulentus]